MFEKITLFANLFLYLHEVLSKYIKMFEEIYYYIKEIPTYIDWAFHITPDHYLVPIIFWLLLIWLGLKVQRITRLYLRVLSPFHGKMVKIVRVADGDTVIVGSRKNKKRRQKVRLIGIDTPESLRSLYQKVMPYGKEASDYTKKRLRKGRRVLLIYDKERRDKFGRILAYVYLTNGEFFNATLTKKGYAFAKAYPPNTKYKNKFERLAQKARRRNRRLWTIYDADHNLKSSYKRTSDYRKFKNKYG